MSGATNGLARACWKGALAGLAALGCIAGGAAAEAELDLSGTWYVLVHYQDSATANPDVWRWEDRIWRFEAKGSRLQWTELPIVVFSDDSGRFERVAGRTARVLEAWEPNAAQLAEIRDGLQVNSRGAKRKRLRKNDDGWASQGAMRVQSASVIGYQENWSITGPPARPVFARDDLMGSGRTQSMEGRTQYATTEVAEDGNRIAGDYARDGTRVGRFQLIRAGETKALDADPEKARQRFAARAMGDFMASNPQVRERFRSGIDGYLAAAGVVLSEAGAEKLVNELAGLWAARASRERNPAITDLGGEGEALYERAVDDYYDFATPGADHDDSARYLWPFASDTPRELIAGPGDSAEHRGWQRYSFDFALPEGTAVRAARAGRVVRVVEDYPAGADDKALRARENRVLVLHDDGTFGVYGHLKQKSVQVGMGQTVTAGDVLALSGSSGQVDRPKLHFSVWRLARPRRPESVKIRFEGPTEAGAVPEAGQSYGGAVPSDTAS
ncbi:MAG: M23 family metallopeptidase [Proteobacteria bacterium]|nr:M23 family metallopeptidase [Pseudomonadota bacterium]